MCMRGWRIPAILTCASERVGDISLNVQCCCQNRRPRLVYWGLQGCFHAEFCCWFGYMPLVYSIDPRSALIVMRLASQQEANFLPSLRKKLHCVARWFIFSYIYNSYPLLYIHYLKKLILAPCVCMSVFFLPHGEKQSALTPEAG